MTLTWSFPINHHLTTYSLHFLVPHNWQRWGPARVRRDQVGLIWCTAKCCFAVLNINRNSIQILAGLRMRIFYFKWWVYFQEGFMMYLLYPSSHWSIRKIVVAFYMSVCATLFEFCKTKETWPLSIKSELSILFSIFLDGLYKISTICWKISALSHFFNSSWANILRVGVTQQKLYRTHTPIHER